MTWELDPIPTQPTTGGYLDSATAAPLLAQMPWLKRLAGMTPAELDAALLRASIEIDTAAIWQGAKADADQEREFPRVAGSELPTAGVPQRVLLAVLHQAEANADGARRQELQARQDGLASKTVGSLSESYTQPQTAGGAAGWSILCAEAQALMSRYRLRSGRIL